MESEPSVQPVRHQLQQQQGYDEQAALRLQQQYPLQQAAVAQAQDQAQDQPRWVTIVEYPRLYQLQEEPEQAQQQQQQQHGHGQPQGREQHLPYPPHLDAATLGQQHHRALQQQYEIHLQQQQQLQQEYHLAAPLPAPGPVYFFFVGSRANPLTWGFRYRLRHVPTMNHAHLRSFQRLGYSPQGRPFHRGYMTLLPTGNPRDDVCGSVATAFTLEDQNLLLDGMAYCEEPAYADVEVRHAVLVNVIIFILRRDLWPQ
ncbi:MAG: hypothetical protein Q9159_001340 [Coniocarpon cinnabarinum]